ncbi:Component of the SF3b subcomplex of the U2 snRNP [Perkinsus olseni]|uniref:Component of the SF3b subcomplex of the U2 snRNP n=1 Tax=Perkinsus olseni TaxID=32597 RepID=A0A7J6LB89_PEROL|nr:Component of the SF3b subcomplex of the U2 snRNP [Perkinsus olseni]KAF4662780.1 Component of the SF3b subcomplex of the U2 snRNP [Perkinsus olseni]
MPLPSTSSTISRDYLDAKAIAFATGPYWIKLLVSNALAGSIIGPHGSRLSKLELDTATVIRISPKGQFFPTTHDRVMVIAAKDGQGASRAIRRICGTILKLGCHLHSTQQSRGHQKDVSIALRLAVPKSTVNSIIGHGGVHARRLEASTGVALVVGERIQGCQERVVELYGPSERIIIAVCDLAENVLKVHPLVRRHIGVLYTTTQETPEDSCFEVTVRISFKLCIFPDLNAAQVGWECGAQVHSIAAGKGSDSSCRAFVVEAKFGRHFLNMPKVRTLHSKKAPEGWDEIEPTLMELDRKMRDAENEPHEDKRKTELLWPIHKLNHQRSRYVFDMYYKKKAISKELFRYCLDEGWADKQLIYKWRKPGYDQLCCMLCCQSTNHNQGTTCICRVPRSQLGEGKVVQCAHCGCRGCASGDQ